MKKTPCTKKRQPGSFDIVRAQLKQAELITRIAHDEEALTLIDRYNLALQRVVEKNCARKETIAPGTYVVMQGHDSDQ